MEESSDLWQEDRHGGGHTALPVLLRGLLGAVEEVGDLLPEAALGGAVLGHGHLLVLQVQLGLHPGETQVESGQLTFYSSSRQ